MDYYKVKRYERNDIPETRVLKHSRLRYIGPKRKKKNYALKTEKYMPNEEGKKKGKKKISNPPTHVLAHKGQYNIYYFS